MNDGVEMFMISMLMIPAIIDNMKMSNLEIYVHMKVEPLNSPAP